MKLHILKPSVNNMAVRVFVRAAKLGFTEDDVYGKTRTQEFIAMNPAHLTPMIEAKGLPKGVLWESCAIMQYLCNKHDLTKFYPKAPARRAMIDSAMFYLIGTLYPYVARATYPALGFPQYAGEVGSSDAVAEHTATAQKAAEPASESAHCTAREFPEQSATIHLLHHFAHLLVLADELIDLGDGRAAAVRDPRFAARIDDLVVVALLLCH